MESLFHVVANLARFKDRNGIFGDRLNDRDDVDFLHAELAHPKRLSLPVEHPVGPLYLTRDTKHWRRVQPGAGDSGYCICASRAGGDHAHAEMIRRLGVCLSAYGTRLFMRIANGNQPWFRRERVVQLHCTAAGDKEYVLHALIRNKTHNII